MQNASSSSGLQLVRFEAWLTMQALHFVALRRSASHSFTSSSLHFISGVGGPGGLCSQNSSFSVAEHFVKSEAWASIHLRHVVALCRSTSHSLANSSSQLCAGAGGAGGLGAGSQNLRSISSSHPAALSTTSCRAMHLRQRVALCLSRLHSAAIFDSHLALGGDGGRGGSGLCSQYFSSSAGVQLVRFAA